MRKTALVFAILLSISFLSCTKTESADLAIRNVTVIDATGAPAQPKMTILIAENRITKISKAKRIKVDKNVNVIDGSGKFLIPGLWDMHVHMNFHKVYMALFIANGVTSARMMEGWHGYYEWRKEICEDKLIGPRMIIASQMAEGPVPGRDDSVGVKNEEEGRLFIRKAKEEGADFIKVLSYLSKNTYFAIIDEAKKQGIPVVGHVPYSVSAAEVSDAGQRSIEHDYGVSLSCSDRDGELRKILMTIVPTPEARLKAYTDIDFSELKAKVLFARLMENGTFVCPTLVVWNELAFQEEEGLAKNPRLKFMPNYTLDYWNRIGDEIVNKGLLDSLKTYRQKGIDLVGKMKDAGVELLAGTDTGAHYSFPGFSLHDELALLVQAGLTPMEALRCATYNPAKFFGKLDLMGTIENNKVADLVLLEANPLEDINNTKKIAAVLAGGKLYKKNELQEILNRIEARANESKKK